MSSCQVIALYRIAALALCLTPASFYQACSAHAGTMTPQVAFQSYLRTVFKQEISSKYFIFYSNIPREALQTYATFSDAFVDVVNRDFFTVENQFPILASVSSNKQSFHEFLKRNFNVLEPPGFGMYIRRVNTFATHHGSGLGTFAHEATHPLIEVSLKHRPSWAVEGIASFFEKFFGYVYGSGAHFTWGYHNPWRIRELGDRLPRLELRNVIFDSQDTSEKRMLAIFLFEGGKWNHFLDLIKKNDRRGYPTFVEAAFQKTLAELEGDWRKYLQKVDRERERIYRIPLSMLFSSKDEFHEFTQRHGLQ